MVPFLDDPVLSRRLADLAVERRRAVDHNEFAEGRRKLRLTIGETARIMNVSERTIRRWEQDPEEGQGRAPSPTAVRIMEWMLDGFRPLQWPTRLR